MVTMTFAEYDELNEKAELTEIKDNFHYPSISEAQEMLDKKDGLLHILEAYYNTTDKEYRSELQRFLYSEINLIESEEEFEEEAGVKGKLNLTEEKNLNILETVKNMEFQMMGYFPTKQEIDNYVRANSEDNLAFLYWLLNCPMEDFTQEERKTKEYIAKLINRRVNIGGRK